MILTSVLPFLHASVLNINTESFRTDTRTHEEGQKSSACFVGEGIFRGNRDSANAATAPGDSSTVKALRVEGTPKERRVKLFCYTLVKNNNLEPRLLHVQKELGDGIFSCDKYVVFSSVSDLGGIAAVPLSEPFDSVGPRKSNTHNFYEAHHRMFKDNAFADTDWVIKTDPDTVWSASGLRRVLAAVRPDFDGYFLNNNLTDYFLEHHVHYHGPPAKLSGGIEIVSTKAMETYRRNISICENMTRDDREDEYLRACLGALSVPTVDRSDLCNFQAFSPRDCKARASHPNEIVFLSMKNEKDWRECWHNMHPDQKRSGDQQKSGKSPQMEVKR